jgi:isocitrate dehydrogenase (NAD+)
MAHRVTLTPGDGTGPELTKATARVLEATGVEFDWDVQPAGAGVMADHGGNPLPDATLESIRRNGVALKGPITTPIGEGFRSVNVGLRQSLDLYAQVRPCKTYPGVRTRYRDVVVVVRDRGHLRQHRVRAGTPDAEELIAWLEQHGTGCRSDSGISIADLDQRPGGCSTRSATRGGWGGARSRPSTRRTSWFTDGLWL